MEVRSVSKRMENHCLALLAYAARQPDGLVCCNELSEECGVPLGTLHSLFYHHRHHGEPNLFIEGKMRTCYLCVTAAKYHYSFRLVPDDKSNFLLSAVFNGYTNRQW